MDFYSVLQACYKKDITPFALYSTMSDLCKGDLELKEQANILYRLYQQGDVFNEISLCDEDGFNAYLTKYTSKERMCLNSVARLMHPRWKVNYESKPSNRQKVKLQRVISNKKVPSHKVLLQQNNNAPRKVVNPPKIKIQNNIGVQLLAQYIAPKPKKVVAKRSVEIKSILSDVEILTSVTATEVEICVHNAGKCLYRKSGIIRRKTCVYINVEEVVADKIEITLPKDKYAQLKVYKVGGNLNVIDKENCFEELSICGNVGEINCYTSAKSVYANTQAGNICLEYVALQDGKIDLWNTLGEVKVATSFVKKIAGELFSQKGTVRNIHKQSVGYTITMKIKSKYGDVTIL